MLRGRDVDEIKELKREGLSIRAISRLTGYDRKTISRYLLAAAGRPVYGTRPPAASNLEPFKGYLKERLKAGVWNAQVLFARASGARLWRRLLDSDGVAAPAAEGRVSGWRCGDLRLRQASRRKWIGAILARCLKTGAERAIVGLHDHSGLQPQMMAEAATDQKLGTLLRMHESAFRRVGSGSGGDSLRPDEDRLDRHR